MGLDMYLYKADNNGQYSWEADEVGYWRKANHIHKWFVDNVQNGNDDCGDYEVSREQVLTLYKTCLTVLDSIELVDGKVYMGTRWHNGVEEDIFGVGKVVKDSSLAQKLLPTQDGFFFGGTDYDEWYVDDIKHTIDILQNILSEFDFENNKLIYSSSW